MYSHNPVATSSADQLLEQCCRRPWETYIEPFNMATNIWYISGNNWVSSYLIDSGDGLILIDTAMHETAYLLLENIRKIGLDPADIKKILITHAHIDHMGAARTIKELSGADIYLGERDIFFLKDSTSVQDKFIKNQTPEYGQV